MAASQTIDPWVIPIATSNIMMYAQQTVAKFLPLVTPVIGVSVNGIHFKWEEFSVMSEPGKRTSRNEAAPLLNAGFDARWVSMNIHWGRFWTDKYDLQQVLMDPQSSIVRALGATFARKTDKIIIRPDDDTGYGGFFGTVNTGENAENAVSFSVNRGAARGETPISMIVAVNHGAGANTAMTLEKMIEGKRILGRSHVEMDYEMPYVGLGWTDWAAMINTERQQNKDYTGDVSALVAGRIQLTVGTNPVISTQIDDYVDGSTYRRCPMWTRPGMGVAVGFMEDTFINTLDERPHITQMQMALKLGSVRVDEDRVLEIKCA